MNGLNASAIKYVNALSPLAVADPGSSNPFNLGGAGRFGTLLVAANGAGGVVNVLRSGTSNGTFNPIGCSLTTQASKLGARSFSMQSSAVWYKVSYDDNGAGVLMNIILSVQGQRDVPVEQDSNTFVNSDVLI